MENGILICSHGYNRLTSLGRDPGEGLGILGYGVMGVVGGRPVLSDTNTRHALNDNKIYMDHTMHKF